MAWGPTGQPARRPGGVESGYERSPLLPYGPKGEWRPAETGACAVHVMKIATGEVEETYEPPKRPYANPAEASRRASKAGKARAATKPGGPCFLPDVLGPSERSFAGLAQRHPSVSGCSRFSMASLRNSGTSSCSLSSGGKVDRLSRISPISAPTATPSISRMCIAGSSFMT